MAWEIRGKRLTFYWYSRRGGRVWKRYGGRGLAGRAMEKHLAERRERRAADRQRAKDLEAGLAPLTQLSARLIAETKALVREAFERAGYHCHRSCWRKPMSLFRNQKPRQKSAVTPEAAIFELGHRGRIEALPALGEIFSANPEEAARCGDLAALAEAAWVAQIVGPDLAYAGSLREKLRSLKLELGGPTPSALVHELVGTLAVLWIEKNYTSLLTALRRSAEGPSTAKIRMRQQESANRKYLATIRTLAEVRKREGGAVPAAAPSSSGPVDFAQAPVPPEVGFDDAMEPEPARSRRERHLREEEILLRDSMRGDLNS